MLTKLVANISTTRLTTIAEWRQLGPSCPTFWLRRLVLSLTGFIKKHKLVYFEEKSTLS